MRFYVDQDIGTSISLWVVPDNPSIIPTIEIILPERPPIPFPANAFRPDIRQLGLHNTGQVGFQVTSFYLPDLASYSELSIRDPATGILLHRRHSGLKQRLFHLDLGAPRKPGLEASLSGHFTLAYQDVEKHSFDTLNAVLNNKACQSIYASGHPLLFRYLSVLQSNGYITFATMRQPFEELAERLQLSQNIAHDRARAEEGIGLEPLFDFAANLQLDDAGAIAAAFRGLTDAQADAIANPFVRTLGCEVGERPGRFHVAIALENLAALNLIGMEGRFDEFKVALAELIGHDFLEGYKLERSEKTSRIAAALARIATVRKLLAWDLLLYGIVDDAFRAVDTASQGP